VVWGRWLKHEGAQVVAVVDRIWGGAVEGKLIGKGYFFSTAMAMGEKDRGKMF